jgi:membrane protease YdiL (CAAX protease family)
MSDEAANTTINNTINEPTENAPLEARGSTPAADEGAVPVGDHSYVEPYAVQPYPLLPPPLPFRHRPLDWPSFRTPNFADAGLFFGLLILGFLVASGAVGAALYFHWFGLRNFNDVQNSTGVALGTQGLIYLVALAVAIPSFRMVWGRGFFDGIHWHFATAFRLRYRLFWIAILCNVIAMLGNAFLPFPQHAPIDKLFGTSTDAWMLMAFGVTVAPFFEEMIFRGFLMPALATAWDWFVERSTGRPPRPLDAAGNPVWSGFAAVFAAMTASVPFAWMHSEQVGRAWGPLLLLYCVSLILCTVRLVTRSLAASTLTHSTYNFLLFTMMLWQTGGFRHMDKM